MKGPESVPVGRTITVDAPAKVNLALNVGPVGPDGYHPVSTVMLTVGLTDTLTVRSGGPGVTLVRDPDPGFPVESDLTVRAVRALAAATGREPDVDLSLVKRIPVAAGLGGGSADCAAALVACCALWSLDTDSTFVAGVAAALGSDVPFMLRGGCALYGGRGDLPVATLQVPDLDLVLVNGRFPVPTAEVYRAFDSLAAPGRADVAGVVAALASGDPAGLSASLANDLTDAALAVAPGIAEVLSFVGAQPGIEASLVAGSGGTVFGIAESADAAASAAAEAGRHGWWAAATSSRAARPKDEGAGLRVY